MRTARRSTRRPILIGLGMLTLLFMLFGRPSSSSSSTYDPALAALRRPTNTTAPSHHDIHASIVVPCYHERDNLRPLVTRVFAALRNRESTEIVLVDDNSRDGTVEEVQKLKEEGYQVVLVVRTDEKGLSSAVLRGFEEARGTNLVVMDADLQVSSLHYHGISRLRMYVAPT
jgi:cellulose synthase/poly-beta-1,6-N-acetylglucosamine synthase-like glycosyltransferase